MTTLSTLFTPKSALTVVALAVAWMIASPLVPASLNGDLATLGSAYAKRGADDGPNHDVNDDKGHHGKGHHGRDDKGHHGGKHDKDDDHGKGHHDDDHDHDGKDDHDSDHD